MSWTKEQEDAIFARNNNLLVTASAGSGKTAILVERIIQLICRDRIDLDRLLIVTFTNAAAAEMRQRISAALLAEMDQENGNEEQLRRQLNLLSRSSISTLHAFCTDIVRKHFHLLEIDPNFRIGNKTETELIKLEIIEEYFEEEYEKDSELFLGLVEMFGANMNDLPFQDLFLRTYEFIQSQPYPLQWFRDSIARFNCDEEGFAESSWGFALIKELKIKLQAAHDVFEAARLLTEQAAGLTAYQTAILDDLQIVRELQESLMMGISSFHEHAKEVKHKKLARISKSAQVDPELQEEVKLHRDDGKKLIAAMRDLMARSPAEYIEDLHRIYPFMDYLGDMLSSFSKRYQEKKAEKGILDFNDLEHMALYVLANEPIANEYRRHYLYIFVDEYQDSNLVQETILNFIKNKDNLFLVGDVKQSIYRFRLADPSLFMEKHQKYSKAKDVLHRRIDLNRNFRSNCEIINAVNYIFTQIMSREFGEIDYDEDSRLYAGLQTDCQCAATNDALLLAEHDLSFSALSVEPELYIIENKQNARESFIDSQANEESENYDEELVDSSNEEDAQDLELEARLAAIRIKELSKMDFFDRASMTWRKIEYRDIVVLMRASRNSANVFLEHFLLQGIPSYADIESGYFETLEIELFINLLRLIDNKYQDIPLLSVLRSPIANFTIEELIKIRIESPREQNQIPAFYKAVQYYCENQDDDLAVKLENFLNRLKEWKSEARYMRMDDFIWKLFLDTGYYYYAGAMPGGLQRQANLRILYDRARQFQTTSIRGLFKFIKFVDKLRASKGDMGNAMILGERDNVVRIMSIHKSKGLEFPVVILAGMGRKFNLRDTSSPILMHRELGLGPRYIDPALRTRQDTIARLIMRNVIKMESLAEEMRILYVAMTRPQEKLIMVGTVRNMDRCLRSWSKVVNPYNLSRGKSYLDWLGAALIRHVDGGTLRHPYTVFLETDSLIDDDSRWIIKRIDHSFLQQEELIRKLEKNDIAELIKGNTLITESKERTTVWEQLNWEYPYQEAALIPSKLTVTALKNIKNRNLENLRVILEPMVSGIGLRDRKMEADKKYSAAQKGTIIHFIMQHLDFSKTGTHKIVNEQILNMVDNGLLEQEAAAAIEIKKIVYFFKSDIGQRVLNADRIYREVPFNLLVEASEVIEGINSDETMLIQGVIDLCFQEGEQLVLVDYKSDWIDEGKEEEIVERYRLQLEWYKKALERIEKRSVKESYLYLFHINQAIRVDI
ncbi:MAG: UvrD-helicase domain-containing protein [Syntrophomonadaceae bacterium]|nr:UvrD-helicase domain-containing protein [Syntrophomonadaceae bacterium]